MYKETGDGAKLQVRKKTRRQKLCVKLSGKKVDKELTDRELQRIPHPKLVLGVANQCIFN